MNHPTLGAWPTKKEELLERAMATEYPGYSSILDDRPFCYFQTQFRRWYAHFCWKPASSPGPSGRSWGWIPRTGPTLASGRLAGVLAVRARFGMRKYAEMCLANLGFSEFLGAKKMELVNMKRSKGDRQTTRFYCFCRSVRWLLSSTGIRKRQSLGIKMRPFQVWEWLCRHDHQLYGYIYIYICVCIILPEQVANSP